MRIMPFTGAPSTAGIDRLERPLKLEPFSTALHVEANERPRFSRGYQSDRYEARLGSTSKLNGLALATTGQSDAVLAQPATHLTGVQAIG